jgi:hypothetical protein
MVVPGPLAAIDKEDPTPAIRTGAILDPMATPSPNGSNGSGRDGSGRFAAGNPGGPGNPYARRVAALRSALVGAVTVDDMCELARGLLEKAKAGDMTAARLLLSYTVGTARGADEGEIEIEAERRIREMIAEAKQRRAERLTEVGAPTPIT